MYTTLVVSKPSKKLMFSIIAIAIMTWIHHIYGGLIYDTAYRMIMPSISIPLLLLATFYLQYRLILKTSNTLKYGYIFIVSLFWIISIGLIEGFYNHVLKNILFFTGFPEDKLSTMFPPEFGKMPFFELPNDIFFEVTGILQFLIGILVFYNLRNFLKSLKH